MPDPTEGATTAELPSCRVCGTESAILGDRHSAFSGRSFTFARCSACGYAFVIDPRTDFHVLYDASYYAGDGADPLTDYAEELNNPRSVRQYEWASILKIVDALIGITPETRWLDHGCGLGGAVQFALDHGVPHACGLEDGYAGDRLRGEGTPCITSDDIESRAGTFDVVTSIDVIEHSIDPVRTLREIRTLLKPGGVAFVVTGNAAPFRRRLLKWAYTSAPEVHVGFFEPRTLVEAYRLAGLEPVDARRLAGYRGLVRYKVLKVLGVRSRSWLERCAPWPVITRAADFRYKISEIPSARRPV